MTESDYGAAVTSRLREQYFLLLPKVRLLAARIETEIRYEIRDIASALEPYEQVVVKSRIKDCESAIRKLLSEGNVFDPDRNYTLTSLNDLAGIRVLVFPGGRLLEIEDLLRKSSPFRNWTSKPLKYARGFLSCPKYYGTVESISSEIKGEYQIVPMLMGNFWDVEHSAMYKPFGWAKGAERDHEMKTLRTKIEVALARFENRFESFVEQNRSLSSGTH